MIELNLTLLYQVGGFFALYFILNTLLYKPVLMLLEERNKNIAGRKKEAADMENELQKKLQGYEKKLSDTKIKAQEERLRLRQEGLDKEREIFELAKKDSQGSLSEAKAKLAAEIKASMSRLKEDSKIYSKDITEKFLGRKVA